MFGFGRKRMTEEEIAQRLSEMEQMSDEAACRAALALEKDAPEAAAVILTKAYLLGAGVERNNALCTQYAQRALSKYPDRGDLWLYGGTAYSNMEEYSSAVNFLKKAMECPDMGEYAAASYANNCFQLACQLKSASNHTWKINEYNAANFSAAAWYAESVGCYCQTAQNGVCELDTSDWFIYGTGLRFLLEMCYHGQLANLGTQDNSVGSWITGSFKALESKMDVEQQRFWKDCCLRACAQMDQAGQTMIAETFRACFCGYIAKFEHDAGAYYRAKWHYARCYELLKTADEEGHEYWNSFHDIIMEAYNSAGKSYGSMAVNQMLDGVLPNLAPSYPEGETPDPESCASFMEEFHRERDMAQMKHDLRTGKAGGSEKKKGGLFGLFRK